MSSVVPADAEQVLLSAQEDLSVANRGRSEGAFADLVLRDWSEVFGGGNYVRYAVVVQEIDEVIRRYERSVMFTKPFGPLDSAGRGVEAMRDAGIGNDEKEITRRDR